MAEPKLSPTPLTISMAMLLMSPMRFPQYPEAVPVAAPLLVKRPVVAAAPIAVAHAAPFAAPLLSRAVVSAPAVAHPAPAHPLQG